MAKSGSYTSTKYDGNYSIIFDWSVVSQNVETNTSTLQLTWTFKCNSSYGANIDAASEYSNVIITYYIDGKKYELPNTLSNNNSGYHYFAGNTSTVLGTATVEVPHDSVDYQSFSWSWNNADEIIKESNSHTTQKTAWSASGSGVIDYIVRAASITDILVNGQSYTTLAPSEIDDEDTFAIVYSNPAGEFATELQACISFTGANDDIPYRNIVKTGTVYTFYLTAAEKSTLYTKLNAGQSSIAVRFYVRSRVPVLDGSTFETVHDYITLTINFVNYKPTLSPVVKDMNSDTLALTGNDQILVRHMSTAYFETGAKSYKDASIVTQSVSNGDVTIYNTPTGSIENVANNTFYFTVQDSRGHALNDFIAFNGLNSREWIEYIKPTCTITEALLDANSNGNIIITGKYFGGNFGVADNKMTVDYCITKSDSEEEGTWVTLGFVEPTVDDEGNYTYSFIIPSLDYTGRYNLQVKISDELNTSAISQAFLAAVPLFDWDANDFQFYIPVEIQEGSVYGAHVLHSMASAGTIELKDSIENYKFLEIFYTDNNKRGYGFTKVPVVLNADGTLSSFTIDLSLIEASSATSTYIRRTAYICSGNTMTPALTAAGYALISGSTVSHSAGTNYLRITRVVGYK